MSKKLQQLHKNVSELIPTTITGSQREFVQARQRLLALSKFIAEIRRDLLIESKELKQAKRTKRAAKQNAPSAGARNAPNAKRKDNIKHPLETVSIEDDDDVISPSEMEEITQTARDAGMIKPKKRGRGRPKKVRD